MWGVSNLVRGKPKPNWNTVKVVIPCLLRCLSKDTDSEVLADVCWGMSYMSESDVADHIWDIINMGLNIDVDFIKIMIGLISTDNDAIRVPSLRVCGNLVTGDDVITQLCLDKELIRHVRTLAGHPKRNIRREAAWTFSNITAGNKKQIQLCIDSHLIQLLIQMLQDEEACVRKEVIWALCNATSGAGESQNEYMFQNGVLDALAEQLCNNDEEMESARAKTWSR